MHIDKIREFATGCAPLTADVCESDRILIKQELYNAYSAQYEGRTKYCAHLYEKDYDFFRMSVDGRVLDLGCGPGRDAQQLSLRGLSVLGVDLSAYALMRAADKGIETRQMNYEKDLRVFSDGYFDGVWTNCSLTTTPLAQIRVVLSELYRITKPTGALFFGFIEGMGRDEGWLPADKKYALPRYRFRDTPTGLRQIVCDAGFIISHVRTIPKEVAGKNTYINIHAMRPL
ncbi:MAG TPA: class I SAM-dependent methyltransferase [Acidobacteriota bacterium]|nr:class I SAM-dependent methyltransferase [Acidobacteriota bacterium]